MKALRVLLVLSVAALVVWPVIYTARHYAQGDYRLAFMSSLAATVIGLAAGIPVGLEINRRQAAVEELRSAVQRESEAREHRDRILSLIGKELGYNELIITGGTEENAGAKKRSVSLPMLKQDVWEAFSDGGELRWVSDPNLLDEIANAYYHIRGIAFLEEKFFEAAHFPGLRTSNIASVILGYLEKTDQPALYAIRAARSAIEQARATSQSFNTQTA
jgi:hypothetical protein